MGPKIVCLLIFGVLISTCASQYYNYDWVPIGINTFTSGRIMGAAADHIGVRLYRELYALKKMYIPLYRVTFLGQGIYGMMHQCTATVSEYGLSFRPQVLTYNCWPPVYSSSYPQI